MNCSSPLIESAHSLQLGARRGNWTTVAILDPSLPPLVDLRDCVSDVAPASDVPA